MQQPFRRALVISLLNPKAILFLLSFFVQFIDPQYESPAVPFLILSAIIMVSSMAYLSALIFAGVRLAQTFRRRVRLTASLSAGVGGLFMWFAAKLAGAARTRTGEQLDLIEKDAFRFCWIIDFPFYEWSEEDKKVDFAHNPFSMPQGGLEALQTQDPLTIKAYQYDMVCNGYELASGSIRNQHPDLMVKAFELTGLTQADVEDRFGGMYRAFQYGAPPHGGMAAGVDRMVMLLCGVQNLREITLFPMNQRAEDLLMGAPSPAEHKQLRELNIRVVEQPPKAQS